MATRLPFTPQPTPYLSPQNGGNPYVPAGTVSYPVSQNALPVATARTGGTLWAGNTYGYNTTPYTVTPPTYTAPTTNTNGSVQGVSTTNTNNNSNNNSGPSQADIARAIWERQVNSYKDQANNIRNNAVNTFNDLIGAVNAFRARNKELYGNADQQITNRASEILGSNARTNADLEGTLRAKGRSMGLGDSSKFLQQNKLAGQLAANQGSTLATRGEQQAANTALFNTRQDQAQGQEDQANTYLKAANDQATQVQNSGYDTADSNFVNSLNQLANYQRLISQIAPLQANGLTQYTPDFSNLNLMNTLNGMFAASPQQGQTQDAQNLYNPQSLFDLLKQQRGQYLQA